MKRYMKFKRLTRTKIVSTSIKPQTVLGAERVCSLFSSVLPVFWWESGIIRYVLRFTFCSDRALLTYLLTEAELLQCRQRRCTTFSISNSRRNRSAVRHHQRDPCRWRTMTSHCAAEQCPCRKHQAHLLPPMLSPSIVSDRR